jgi:hypothetical protein
MKKHRYDDDYVRWAIGDRVVSIDEAFTSYWRGQTVYNFDADSIVYRMDDWEGMQIVQHTGGYVWYRQGNDVLMTREDNMVRISEVTPEEAAVVWRNHA